MRFLLSVFALKPHNPQQTTHNRQPTSPNSPKTFLSPWAKSKCPNLSLSRNSNNPQPTTHNPQPTTENPLIPPKTFLSHWAKSKCCLRLRSDWHLFCQVSFHTERSPLSHWAESKCDRRAGSPTCHTERSRSAFFKYFYNISLRLRSDWQLCIKF